MCNARNAETPNSKNAQTSNVTMRFGAQKASPPRLLNDALLQTFRAWMTTPARCCYIGVVFDVGSQRTFVTESVVSKLQLDTVAKTELTISAFGSASGPDRRYQIVKFVLRSQHDSVTVGIEAIVVPFLCEEMAEAPSENRFRQGVVGED